MFLPVFQLSAKIAQLREDIATRSAINELMEDEYHTMWTSFFINDTFNSQILGQLNW